jgi:hypothetical protein
MTHITTTASPVPRNELTAIFKTPRALQAYENLTLDVVENIPATVNGIVDAPILTFGPTDALDGAKSIEGSANIDIAEGAGSVVIDLTLTGVAFGIYGSPTRIPIIIVDSYGRITMVSDSAILSGNVVETANLFFTDARARAALSADKGISYNSGSGVISGPYVAVPANSASPGTAGQYALDANYAYFCIAANSWRRVAVTTF